MRREHLSGLVYRVWTRSGIFAIVLLAFAIQFYHLGVRTFHGDELGSLVDANDLSKNLQALAYFYLLHLWSAIGSSEFWMRSLSVFFTVLAVAVIYAAAKKLSNRRIALMASFLLATSPFAEVYAQQVRFYSLFLLSACLVLWAFATCLRSANRRDWVLLGLGNLLLLLTHLMSTFLLMSEALTAFMLTRKFSRLKKIIGLGVLGGGCMLVLVPPIREIGFNILSSYVADPTRYSVARGLGLAQLAKIPLNGFFFTFGESVYPLTYWLVVPGSLVYSLALILGLRRLHAHPRLFVFIIVTTSFSILMLYLVLDALIPPQYTGASPRYLIFLLPLFFLIAAVGLEEKNVTWLLVPLVVVNMGSLGLYWFGDWAYTDDLIDWQAVSQWTAKYVTPHTLVLVDGRSRNLANRYFPAEWNLQNEWNYQSAEDLAALANFSRLIIFSYNFNLEPRAQVSALIQRIGTGYNQAAVWSRYPLFIDVFDRKPASANSYRVDTATGSVNIPIEVYGLEFQDVRLPIPLAVGNQVIESMGAFGLPGLQRQTTRMLPLETAVTTQKIWLMSDLIGANPAAGTLVANLRVVGTDGLTQTIPLRVGFETGVWNGRCQPGACIPAFTWRKRLALLGSESYPGSWQEFDASVFASELDLKTPMSMQSLEIQRVSSPGTLYVWALVLR